MTAYTVSDWSDFFVAAAGASAALTGLVFVAVSINIDRILRLPGVPERALGTLLLLLDVVVASLLALAPGQSATAIGVELLAQGLLFTVTVLVLTLRSLTDPGVPRGARAWRIAFPALGTVPFVIGAASLVAGVGGGLYWVLAGTVFALVGAVVNAWVLLVEILR